MNIEYAVARAAGMAAVAFVVFWPLLTWWLRRWYQRHWWHPLYEFDSPHVKRRLLFLGALWALLPAAYAFAWGMFACLT